MIAIQVAIGIVLAYIIIVNQRVLLRFGKTTAKVILWFAMMALLAYFATLAYQAVAPTVSPAIGNFLSKLGTFAVVIVVFVVAGISGHGLLTLWHKLRRQEPPKPNASGKQDNALIAWSMINAIIVVFVFYSLSLTPLVEIYNGIDNWSRSSGYSDLGVMLLFAAALPWPFIPLWLVHRRERTGQERQQQAE